MILRGFTHDTNMSEYLRFTDAKAYGLDAIGERRFPRFSGYKLVRTEEVMQAAAVEWQALNPGKKLPAVFRGSLSEKDKYLTRNKVLHLRHLSLETLRLYNGGDCDLTKRIEVSNKKHVPQALMNLYIDLSFILHEMEPLGPEFDYEQCAKLEIIYPIKEKKLRWRLRRILKNKKYNPGSSQQVYTALYRQLKLRFPFEGKPHTRKMALLMLGRDYKFPRLQLEWRKVARVGSTLKGYRRCADAHGGRLRTRWWGTGTRTGRLSSGGEKNRKDSTLVNLQNIKKDPQIKNLCVADSNWQKFYAAASHILAQYRALRIFWKKSKKDPKLVADTQVLREMQLAAAQLEAWVRENMPDLSTYLVLDYGQVEVRVAAQLSGDKNLMADCQAADIHTTVGVTMTGWDPDRIKNDEAVRTLTKNCIAEGQRVLTHVGLVPIQKVTKSMLVWDGVEFVTHDGVIDSGIQEVITFDGLTATQDHEVWTDSGKLALGKAQEQGSTLVVTGDKETPIRYTGDNLSTDISSKQLPHGRCSLFSMWESIRCICRQYIGWTFPWLRVSAEQEIQRSESVCPSGTVFGNSAALRQSGQSELGELWRAGYLQQVPDMRGVCGVYAKGATTPNIQRRGNRQEEEQWALRAGQYSVGYEEKECTQQTDKRLGGIQREATGSYCGGTQDKGRVSRYTESVSTCEQIEKRYILERFDAPQKQKVRVYDILNAGPRHRFTVEGKLVSNCHFGILFGISKANLFKFVVAMSPPDMRDRISEEQVNDAYDRYFERYPGIKQFIIDQREFARANGYVETLFGMKQLLNITDSSSEEESIEYIDPDEVGKGRAYWGNQAINGPVQGTAHQLMICALVNLVRKRKKYKVLGIPPMEVHDALYFRVSVLELIEAHAKAKYLLEQESLNTVASDFPEIKWKVPIVVDAKAGIRLGCQVKVNEKSTVGGFLLDWFRVCREQVRALDAELEAAA